MAYSSLSDAKVAFDRDYAAGKATTSDWGSYYNSTANSSGGGKVTNTGNYYTYTPSGSAYYTDNSGNKTQLSGSRGSESYVNGQFKSNGNGGHTSVGYDPSLSGTNSASRELSAQEKAYYDQLVSSVINTKYGGGSSVEPYNKDLQYALSQSGMSAAEYRQDMLNRVGTVRSNGTFVTQADVDKELNRLGLGSGSPYDTDEWYNAINTGNLGGLSGLGNLPMNGGITYPQGGGSLGGGTNQIGVGGNNPALDYLQKALKEAEAAALARQEQEAQMRAKAEAAQRAQLEALREQLRAAEAARQARINALVGQINAKKPEIENQSADLARQAYINQRLGQQAARENLAASGLSNTGVSETTNLGLQTAYQQALDEIGKNKQNAMLDLDQAIYQARQTGDADLATLQSNHVQAMAQLQTQQEQELYNRWLNGQNLGMQQDATNWNNAMALQQLGLQMDDTAWNRNYAMQQLGLQQDATNWERQLAMQQYNYMMQQNQLSSEADKMYKLLNQGLVTPEVLQYYGLGSTGDYYNYLNQLQRAQMVPKTSGSRSASSRGGAGSEELFSSGVMPKATTNATFGGQQYQLTPNELETLFRTTTAGDIFGNLTPDDPTAYLRR